MTKLYMSNPFYNLDSPDEKKEAKSEGGIPNLEGLLRKYEKVLDDEKIFHARDNILEKFQTIDDILTPEQINTFLQITIIYEEHNNYQDNTGYFISKLIQNSYDAGYNDFVINTKALKEINRLGYRLTGKKDKPIEIAIKGNAGDKCGADTKYSNFKIQGNTRDMCGSLAKHSNFEIQGNVENMCGEFAEHSNFTIQCNAGYYCGEFAEHSNFNIKGNTGSSCGSSARYSNFKIKGNTEYNCGYGAEHSNFEIEGNTGFNCGGGDAKNSYFDMHGDFGASIGGRYTSPDDCTFITYKENLYERLRKELSHRKELSRTNGANKAILKDKKGNIIEEKII